MLFKGDDQDTTKSADPQQEVGPQPTMRRSCAFCRSRKIRCSSQSVCSACRERNINCVYGREGSKGRPKGVVAKFSARAPHQKPKSEVSSPRITDFQCPPAIEPLNTLKLADVQSSPPNHIPDSNPRKRSRTGNLKATKTHTIALDLKQTFNQLFDDKPTYSAVSSSKALTAFNSKYKQCQASHPRVNTLPRPAVTYEEPLSVLVEDFVEMVTIRFGDLGSPHSETDGSLLFKRCLIADNIPDMFEDLPNGDSPLDQYSSRQTIQMIDVWFSHHPLSFIISKTLLLKSYRDGTHNKVLLAVVLADVNFAQQEPDIRAKGEQMFNWANSRLFDIPNASIDLAIVQALTLLGWYELCASRARRSICYFLHANKILSSLEMPTVQLNQINGMDIGEVEAELATCVRWLTFSVILWAFMQMDAPLLDLLPSNHSARFPPSDESTSAVFALDSASDNIATLRQQAKGIRDLWPISHIASTTAHIYTLAPQEQGSVDASEALCWQSSTLHRLRQLSNPQSMPQDLSSVCSNVLNVLVGALKLLESHTGDRISQALLLSAYHTMIIHFLVPRTQNHNGSSTLTEGLINDFECSTRSLLRVSLAIDGDTDSGGMTRGLLPNTLGEVFALGLGACGKLLAHVQERSKSFKLESEGRLILAKHDVLSELASELRDLSQHENLRKARRTKAAKKQLKRVMQVFDDEMADVASSLAFPPLKMQPPLVMDADPSATWHADFVPGLTNSPTDSSALSTPMHSRVSSNDPAVPPGLDAFDPSLFNFSTYGTNPSFMNPTMSALDWGSDMLDPRAFDGTAMPDFSIQDGAGPHNFNIYHDGGKTSGGACFDDSVFCPR